MEALNIMLSFDRKWVCLWEVILW
uniref:Uncharacterized protein n=1 Tax=Rhizophora mucronata TaxID=61149 RepID=A0A2P2PT88_RHIMU